MRFGAHSPRGRNTARQIRETQFYLEAQERYRVSPSKLFGEASPLPPKKKNNGEIEIQLFDREQANTLQTSKELAAFV